MKKMLKWSVNRTILPLVQYLSNNIRNTPNKIETISNINIPDVLSVNVKNLAQDFQTTERWRYPHMISRVLDKEMDECVDLIRKNLHTSYLAPNNIDIRCYCLERIKKEGLILEFGVYQATSTNYMADKLASLSDQRLIHGFDSFEGLQTDGAGWCWDKGRFNMNGNLPNVRNNVRLYKGWVDETLPLFLKTHTSETIAFIHIDTDLYEPAKVILENCKSQLRPGSIILFDELIGYAGWKFHEYKALNEIFGENEYEYIAFSDAYQAAIRIK